MAPQRRNERSKSGIRQAGLDIALLFAAVQSSVAQDDPPTFYEEVGKDDMAAVLEAQYELLDRLASGQAQGQQVDLQAHTYCHIAPYLPTGRVCRPCTSYLAPPAGRVDCLVRFGEGRVNAGACETPENVAYCTDPSTQPYGR